MSHLLFRIYSACAYYCRAVTVYQLHSPFLYQLAEATLEDQRRYYAFDDIEDLRRVLNHGNTALMQPPRKAGNPQQTLGLAHLHSIRQDALSSALGQLLFRMALHYKPARILELGTGPGISTAYLASACPRASIETIDADAATCELARTIFKRMGLRTITVTHGNIPDTLTARNPPLHADLIFANSDRSGADLLATYETLLPFVHDQTILIFGDIRRSAQTFKAWKQIISRPEVRLSAEFRKFGLLSYAPGILTKQHKTLIRKRWKPWTALKGW